MQPEALYEMYVKPWHPELARVGMRVLPETASIHFSFLVCQV